MEVQNFLLSFSAPVCIMPLTQQLDTNSTCRGREQLGPSAACEKEPRRMPEAVFSVDAGRQLLRVHSW